MLYVFPKDYRAKLAGKSFRMKVEPLIDKTKVLDCWRDETKFIDKNCASHFVVSVVNFLSVTFRRKWVHIWCECHLGQRSSPPLCLYTLPSLPLSQARGGLSITRWIFS